MVVFFSQSKAIKWCKEDGMMDGLTTNGVLILHPLSGEHGVMSAGPGVWREVSIAGNIYGLRKARSDRGAGKKVGQSTYYSRCEVICSIELSNIVLYIHFFVKKISVFILGHERIKYFSGWHIN